MEIFIKTKPNMSCSVDLIPASQKLGPTAITCFTLTHRKPHQRKLYPDDLQLQERSSKSSH